MERHRHRWLRSREKGRRASLDRNKAVIPTFWSDNDLYQRWMWARVAIPMTLLSYGALRQFGVPLDYTPLATVPALAFYLALKLMAWRDRRMGRRFSHYDTDDISW
jgi:hypothetical protein